MSQTLNGGPDWQKVGAIVGVVGLVVQPLERLVAAFAPDSVDVFLSSDGWRLWSAVLMLALIVGGSIVFLKFRDLADRQAVLAAAVAQVQDDVVAYANEHRSIFRELRDVLVRQIKEKE